LCNRQRFINRNRSACNTFGKRFTLDKLKHKEAGAIDFFQIVDRADVRMVQGCEHLGFAQEAAYSIGITREFFRQDLDRDVPLEFQVPCAIDLAHAAFSQQRGDFVRAELLPDTDRHRNCAYLFRMDVQLVITVIGVGVSAPPPTNTLNKKRCPSAATSYPPTRPSVPELPACETGTSKRTSGVKISKSLALGLTGTALSFRSLPI